MKVKTAKEPAMSKFLCLFVSALFCLAVPLTGQAQPDSVGVRLPMVCNTSVEQPLSPYFVAGFAGVNGAGDLQVNLTGVQPGAYYCQGKCYGAVVSEFPGLVFEPVCGVASDNGHLVIDVPGFFAPLMQQALNNDHVAVYACFGLSLRLGSVVQAALDVGCASGPVDTSICAPAGGACPCGACP
jgi:hypothetical protein